MNVKLKSCGIIYTRCTHLVQLSFHRCTHLHNHHLEQNIEPSCCRQRVPTCPPPHFPWEVLMSIPLLQGAADLSSVPLFCLILNSVCVNSHVCRPGSGFLQLPSALSVAPPSCCQDSCLCGLCYMPLGGCTCARPWMVFELIPGRGGGDVPVSWAGHRSRTARSEGRCVFPRNCHMFSKEGSVHLFALGPQPNLEYLLDECLFKERWNLSPCLMPMASGPDCSQQGLCPDPELCLGAPQSSGQGRSLARGTPGLEALPLIGCGTLGSPFPPWSSGKSFLLLPDTVWIEGFCGSLVSGGLPSSGSICSQLLYASPPPGLLRCPCVPNLQGRTL